MRGKCYAHNFSADYANEVGNLHNFIQNGCHRSKCLYGLFLRSGKAYHDVLWWIYALVEYNGYTVNFVAKYVNEVANLHNLHSFFVEIGLFRLFLGSGRVYCDALWWICALVD